MKLKWMTLIAICCMVIACSSNEEPIVELVEPQVEVKENRLQAISLTDDEKEIAMQSLDFAFRLFQQVDSCMPEKEKIVISPLSATFALSMLTNGSTGETQRELIDALGFEGLELADVNAFSKRMLEELLSLDLESQVGIANSLWTDVGFAPLASYINVLKENYDAEVQEYDFKQGPAAINQWCAEKTNGCIPEFLKTLNPEQRMLLLNALYFKSRWTSTFNEKNTQKSDFTNEDGTKSQVELMRGKKETAYAHTDHFDIAQLNYGNRAFSLQIILPAEGTTIDDCLNRLNAEVWQTARKQMKKKEVDFQLPKFKIESNEDISGALILMGMHKSFTGDAEFSCISREPLYVSFVQQANYFALDEKGTEATVITGTGWASSTGEVSEKVSFHVNRPFLFILKENSTNIILFMGKVEKM